MEHALILSADKYEFTDDKTGEVRRGVTVQYVTDYREDTPASVGFKPIKAPATPEVFESIKKSGAPALYKLESKTKPGKDAKPTLLVVRADLVKGVKIFDGS